MTEQPFTEIVTEAALLGMAAQHILDATAQSMALSECIGTALHHLGVVLPEPWEKIMKEAEARARQVLTRTYPLFSIQQQ